MADQKTYKEKPKPIHPEGQFAALCVDFIDHGECVIEFPGSDSYVGEKVRYIWNTEALNPDTQKPFEPNVEYTVSMSQKANLRKALEAWRGKPYTPEQIEAGIPFHKVVGQWCMLTVAHVPTKAGRSFAKVTGIAPLHPAIPKPDLPSYKRNEFWAKVTAEYKAKVDAFRHTDTAFASEHADIPQDWDEVPPADSDPESLPF